MYLCCIRSTLKFALMDWLNIDCMSPLYTFGHSLNRYEATCKALKEGICVSFHYFLTTNLAWLSLTLVIHSAPATEGHFQTVGKTWEILPRLRYLFYLDGTLKIVTFCNEQKYNQAHLSCGNSYEWWNTMDQYRTLVEMLVMKRNGKACLVSSNCSIFKEINIQLHTYQCYLCFISYWISHLDFSYNYKLRAI